MKRYEDNNDTPAKNSTGVEFWLYWSGV